MTASAHPRTTALPLPRADAPMKPRHSSNMARRSASAVSPPLAPPRSSPRPSPAGPRPSTRPAGRSRSASSPAPPPARRWTANWRAPTPSRGARPTSPTRTCGSASTPARRASSTCTCACCRRTCATASSASSPGPSSRPPTSPRRRHRPHLLGRRHAHVLPRRGQDPHRAQPPPSRVALRHARHLRAG